MTLTDEEIDVLREAIVCLRARRPTLSYYSESELRTRAIAEDLYSRLRLEGVTNG